MPKFLITDKMALGYKHGDKNVERRPATTIAPTLFDSKFTKKHVFQPRGHSHWLNFSLEFCHFHLVPNVSYEIFLK